MKKSLEEKISYAARDLDCYLWDKSIEKGSTDAYDWAIKQLASYKKDCEEEIKQRKYSTGG